MTGRVPVVSVIMPVYGNDDYLAESIGSILGQTLRDLELILMCDDPSEKTRTIISEFQKTDDRIQVVYQKRKGLITSLNDGISLATGTFIARMDADDICYPERLEKQVAFMEKNSGCALVATQVEWINESGDLIGHWKSDLKSDTADKIRKILPQGNCIAHPTVLIRRAIINRYRYNPSQNNVEDYDLWLRMTSDNQVLCKLPQILHKLRIHPLSITSISKKESLVSDEIWCKTRYLTSQIHEGHINTFNLMVLLYLVINCTMWPVRHIRLKIRAFL
jgi:glycosyltransferase involved in cell wall biosynthesis